jgi:hypothetical protein
MDAPKLLLHPSLPTWPRKILAAQAFPSNSSPFIGWQQYTIDGQSAIPPKGCAQASHAIVHTRPLPLLGALGQADPHPAEVNIPRFFARTPKAWRDESVLRKEY